TIYAFFLSALYTFVAGQAPPLEFPLTVLFLIVFSVSSIWFAYRAPPNRSRLHAVFGWLLGVIVTCVMIAVYLAVSLSDDPRMRTAPDAARASSLNWPPFRPDTRHSSEGLGISSSTCLCRTTISELN